MHSKRPARSATAFCLFPYPPEGTRRAQKRKPIMASMPVYKRRLVMKEPCTKLRLQRQEIILKHYGLPFLRNRLKSALLNRMLKRALILFCAGCFCLGTLTIILFAPALYADSFNIPAPPTLSMLRSNNGAVRLTY